MASWFVVMLQRLHTGCTLWAKIIRYFKVGHALAMLPDASGNQTLDSESLPLDARGHFTSQRGIVSCCQIRGF
jgi:hypothetical protein